jgi:transcriptional regulator with GAF, ATPase, and Fis domain
LSAGAWLQLVSILCDCLPATLLECELFGYE